MTTDEYVALPEDTGHVYALLDGDLEVNPLPVPRHWRIVKRLARILLRELEDTGLGEVFAELDVIFDARNAAQPDIFFVRAERIGIVGPKNVQGAPDLVIEILSPGTRRIDIGKKKEIYARFGVALYWIVDPKADRIDLLRLEDGKYTLEARVERPAVAKPRAFPGLRLPLDEILAR